MSDKMKICPTCGNKRCPKAFHHLNQCNNSNALGQSSVHLDNAANIISDTTDTPETDAQTHWNGLPILQRSAQIVLADHARNLERQRDEAIGRIKDLMMCEDGHAHKEARKFLAKISK